LAATVAVGVATVIAALVLRAHKYKAVGLHAVGLSQLSRVPQMAVANS
jgi:hypothetical protein